jgi:methylenetetrahydrofolate reductase (NADPH)
MTPTVPSVSFEFFPPKTEKMEQSLWQAIERLAPLAPSFVSVTYGAGGSTRERTHATVARIQAETGVRAAAHLTCVCATRDEIDAIARSYWDAGIRHIVALRGDPPAGVGGVYEPHPNGYAYAVDLVEGLRRVADFEVSVAAYPSGHPHAASLAADIDHLKRKIDAGATRALTQFFFDNDEYFRFVDRARAAGITVPIVPGILPITNYARTLEFAQKCNTRIPPRFARAFEGADEDPDLLRLVAAHVCAEQCQALQDQGVEQFHFYTLNRAELTVAICHLLGVRAKVKAHMPD